MKKSTRMMLLGNGRRPEPWREEPYYSRPAGRFIDRDGREHYDDGRFAPEDRYGPPRHGLYPDWDAPEMHGGRKIGFDVSGSMTRLEPERGNVSRLLDGETVKRWIKSLKNEDGTTGAHWTKDQTTQVLQQRGLDCDPLKFYVAMNLIYSDYCGAAKAVGCSNMDFYVEMAKAFLNDEDAVPDKLAAYYDGIVEH